ncbi:sulfotransferase family protein [Marinobacter lutaoensis]|jgi:hypothetical protein|uniref:sulfotransferase family protein n=1 Tax=Marinobacter lutaoensis TaxID=135739 RepID=UPI00159347CD|nr:sulfotransferase [Marinobacter lutaoensis]NVD34521.1 sulfotransferase [Marinobacter lutaoensis]
MTLKTVIVTGMPRSGTSWLGQIINSNPCVAFRTEPLFSYRFKNRLQPGSTDGDIARFFEELLAAEDDDFLMQRHHVASGAYPQFAKQAPTCLAYKTSRHHELLERFLSSALDLHIIGIVRHPCGAINSWIHSEKEFHNKGCSVDRDWRTGACRKDGVGEYWGFDDWLAVTALFLRLAEAYPERFTLIRYSDLVARPEATARDLFDRAGLEWTEQTEGFLSAAHGHHHDDPYAVFKDKSVNERWQTELDPHLIRQILEQTRAMGLTQFLE